MRDAILVLLTDSAVVVWSLPLAVAVIARAIWIDSQVRKMKHVPKQVSRIGRLTMRILRKVDPEAADEEDERRAKEEDEDDKEDDRPIISLR